jgi:hypothetical protein
VPSAAAPPSTLADTSELRRRLGRARQCADRLGAEPEVTCTIGRVRVEARLLPPAAAAREYVAASGARIAARSGPPACAGGHADERAWSRPSAPSRPVGRYRCRVESGHAAIWWTDEHGVLAHAVASDADLGRLFAWWRTSLGA